MPTTARRLFCVTSRISWPSNGDRTALDIVETIEQAGDRRFPGSGWSHNGNGLAGRHIEGDALEDRTLGIVGKLHVLKADSARADLERLGVRCIHNLRLDLQKIEHLLDIRQTLADFAIDEANEVERHGKLEKQRVDEDEVADGLFAALNRKSRHHHHDERTKTEDDALAEVEPAERRPNGDGGLLIARHGGVEALGFHALIAEIFYRFEVEKRVNRLGVGVGVAIVHRPANGNAPVAGFDRKPDIGPDGHDCDEDIPENRRTPRKSPPSARIR